MDHDVKSESYKKVWERRLGIGCGGGQTSKTMKSCNSHKHPDMIACTEDLGENLRLRRVFAEQLPDQEHAGIFTQIDSGRCKKRGPRYFFGRILPTWRKTRSVCGRAVGAGRYAQRFPGEVCDVKNGGSGTAAEAAASSHESGWGQRRPLTGARWALGSSQRTDGGTHANMPAKTNGVLCAPTQDANLEMHGKSK